MKLGLIIPYRDRKEHLDIFIPYITQHLESQKIDYKIIVVEQANNNAFNKSVLMNAGAKILYDDVDYFCFHDIDIIPENKNSYCLNEHDIIHPCARLILNRDNKIKNNHFYYNMNFDKYFNNNVSCNLIDEKILGQVIIIKKEIWRKHKWNEIFEGYGYEDTEYHNRLEFYDYKIYQSNLRYISLFHTYNLKKNIQNHYLNKLIYYSLIDSYTKYINIYNNYLVFDTKFKIISQKEINNYKIILIDFDKNKYNKRDKIVAFLAYIWKKFLKKIIYLSACLFLFFSKIKFILMIPFFIIIFNIINNKLLMKPINLKKIINIIIIIYSIRLILKFIFFII